MAHPQVGRAVPCPPRLPTHVTLCPGRRARSDAPYLTAIQRGRWPVLGSINPDPGIFRPPECIRSALGTEAGVITKRSACAKNPQVGRAVPCPPRLPTHVTLGPGRRARSDAPYLTAIQRGRWPVLGSINPDSGILYPPECIRSALATEAGQIIKRSACAKNPQVGRAVLCPPRLPTHVTLCPGRRARSDAPYLTAIQRGRWPVLGLVNPDPGILHPSECIRSALATEAGVITKRSACAKNPQVGRAVLCPPRLPTRASWFTTPARTE